MSDDRLITDRLNVGRPWTQAPGLPGHPNSRCIGMASAHVFSAKTGLNLSSVATGTDTVSTVTGLGPVSGTFDVVINAPSNSSVHVPDLPVSAGRSTATSTCRWPSSTAYSRYNRGQLHHHADGRPGHRDARPAPAVGRVAIQGDVPDAVRDRRSRQTREERPSARGVLSGRRPQDARARPADRTLGRRRSALSLDLRSITEV